MRVERARWGEPEMVDEPRRRLAAVPAAEEAPVARSAPDRARAMVEAHFDRIWRLLRRLGVSEASLEDAAQEVFEVAVRRVDVIRPGSEQSYLFGTALRVAKGLRRDAARRVGRTTPFEDDLAAEQASPEELLEQRRKLALLDEILSRLEAPEREVFVLFELEGLTLAEIAALLSIPRGTAASRLRRARTRFVRALRAHRRVERGNDG